MKDMLILVCIYQFKYEALVIHFTVSFSTKIHCQFLCVNQGMKTYSLMCGILFHFDLKEVMPTTKFGIIYKDQKDLLCIRLQLV